MAASKAWLFTVIVHFEYVSKELGYYYRVFIIELTSDLCTNSIVHKGGSPIMINVMMMAKILLRHLVVY